VHDDLPRRTVESLRAADEILAVSQWTRDRVLSLGGIDPERISILPNTVDESRFSVSAKPVRLAERYRIAPDEKVILSVARLDATERYKGYDRLIRCLPRLLKECGPVHFILVGEGEDKARADALAKILGIERYLTLAGFVADEELADHYRIADVFAMPSTGEGFGIVFLEAMSCGTPVIAGNCDGSVDALGNGELGLLIDPENVDEIVDAIKRMIRRDAPQWWFDRDQLHREVVRRFGRTSFRKHLRDLFPVSVRGRPLESPTV
jgi:glycosyltransferase involved in cell wall biosynthesis